ncbi:MAG: hypothetical protein KKC20_25100 [Proteobacteria bacterium]|nr:hypothetical protein [Pseudomonadota bacterium]
MKHVVRVFLSIFLVAGIFIANLSSIPTVSAEKSITSWFLPDSNQAFTIVNIDEEGKSAPDWVQSFSDGMKIDYPDRICHVFRYGDYGWVPEIRQFKNGLWVKVPTTTSRIFGIEEPLYACADTPRGGLYALFAYYSGPVEKAYVPPAPGFDCSTVTWSHSGSPNLLVIAPQSGDTEQHWIFSGKVEGVPASTTRISWEVIEADPSFYVAANGYAGSALLDADNNFFDERYISTGTQFTVLTVLFTESTHQCTTTANLTFN